MNLDNILKKLLDLQTSELLKEINVESHDRFGIGNYAEYDDFRNIGKCVIIHGNYYTIDLKKGFIAKIGYNNITHHIDSPSSIDLYECYIEKQYIFNIQKMNIDNSSGQKLININDLSVENLILTSEHFIDTPEVLTFKFSGNMLIKELYEKIDSEYTKSHEIIEPFIDDELIKKEEEERKIKEELKELEKLFE
jgi:hypothetical protein